MDAHGGGSRARRTGAVRVGVDRPAQCKILKADSIKTCCPPAGRPGTTRKENEGRLLQLRRAGADLSPSPSDLSKDAKANTWHAGALDGSSTMLMRPLGRLVLGVLFNTRKNGMMRS